MEDDLITNLRLASLLERESHPDGIECRDETIANLTPKKQE